MTFPIRVDTPSGRYRMQVERIFAGDSIEKFKITGGSRSFTLQGNRPELLRSGSHKETAWKVLEAPPTNEGNVEAITYGCFMIMQELNLHLSRLEPTYQDYLGGKAQEKTTV